MEEDHNADVIFRRRLEVFALLCVLAGLGGRLAVL